MKNRSHNSRKLGMECLEGRDLMAGNVVVSFSGGDLVVKGDNAANYLKITPLKGKRFEVTGVGGTLVNGQTAPVSGRVTDDVIVRLLGGNDRLTIGSTTKNTNFADRLSINTGSGADFLTLYRVRGVHGTTSMGAESENDIDILNVRQSKFTGNAVIRMGGGNDEANLLRAEAAGNLNVFAGNGDDSVTVSNSKVGNIKLVCGAGDDSAYFSGTNTITGNIFADGGPGEDTANEASGTLYIFDPNKTFEAFNFEGGNADLPG